MSALSQFETTGPASPQRVRVAGLLDLGSALLVAMIVVPQPVLRMLLTDQAGPVIGIVLFVGVLLLISVLVFGVYLAVCAVAWGRTPGMYLLDVGLSRETGLGTGPALRWSLGWALAVIPALLGMRAAYQPASGWPARLSGLLTMSTAPRAD